MYSSNHALVNSWRLMVTSSKRRLKTCSISARVVFGGRLGACEGIDVSPFPVVWNEAEGFAVSSTGFGACAEGWGEGFIDLIPRSTDLSSARLGDNVCMS